MNQRKILYGLLVVYMMAVAATATETETFSFSISTSMAGSATTGVSFDVTTVATRSAGTGSITCSLSYDTSAFELSGNNTKGPYSLSSSSTSQTITWTLTGNRSGSYSIDSECHGSGATASDSDSITITNPPDISLTLTPDPSSIPLNKNVTVVLRIQNSGGAVTSPSVLLNYSSGLTLVSGTNPRTTTVGALDDVSINWTLRGDSSGTKIINVTFTGDNSATKTATSSVIVSAAGLAAEYYCTGNDWCDSGCCIGNFCANSSSCSTTTTVHGPPGHLITTTTASTTTTIRTTPSGGGAGGGGTPKSNVSATCYDGFKNQDETDVDCGGTKCNPCPLSKSCRLNTDCTSIYCDTSVLKCSYIAPATTQPPATSTTVAEVTPTTQVVETTTPTTPAKPSATCNDLIKNCHDGKCEGGVDCGGPCKLCPEPEWQKWLIPGIIVAFLLLVIALALLGGGGLAMSRKLGEKKKGGLSKQ